VKIAVKLKKGGLWEKGQPIEKGNGAKNGRNRWKMKFEDQGGEGHANRQNGAENAQSKKERKEEGRATRRKGDTVGKDNNTKGRTTQRGFMGGKWKEGRKCKSRIRLEGKG
jgi:hypothetical protein